MPTTRGPRLRLNGMFIVTVAAVAAMLYLLVVPLAMQVITSLRGPFLPFGLPTSQWGFTNYQTLYSVAGDLGATVGVTAVYVLGSAMIGMLLGWCLAWLVVRTDLPFRRALAVLVVLPLVIPPIVHSEAFLLMLAPQSGILNQLLRALPWWAGPTGPIDPFAFSTILVVQGLTSVTFPFMFVSPILLNMDGSLEEAGRMSGATPLQVFRRVTLPVLWPGTLGIGILLIILLLGALEIPLLFGQQSGGNILSLKIYNLLTVTGNDLPKYGLAAAYGVNFLVVTAAIFQLYRQTMRKAAQRATLTGKGRRVVRYSVGRLRVPILVVTTLFLIPTILLPLVALVWSSLTPYPVQLSLDNVSMYMSLAAYQAVLADPVFWASLLRTFFIAVTAATISVSMATVAAFVVARTKPSLSTQLLDLLASSSIVVPAAIAGFSSLLLYMVTNPFLHLNGTIWMLILAYSYRIAISYRVTFAAIFQISGELEEAAATSGASRLQTLCRVVLPLIMPTVLNSWAASFVLNSQEFTLPVFLATPETQPISVYMYSRLFPGSGTGYSPAQGAAMAFIFAVLVVVVGLLLRYLAGTRVRRRTQSQAKAPAGATASDLTLPVPTA